MKPRRVTLLVLVPVLAAGVGYYLGATRAQAFSRLTAQAAVPLEYLVSARSFSEVDQARAGLEALAAQRIQLAQRLILQETGVGHGSRGVQKTRTERPVLAAIRLIEDGLAEFQGTGLEMRLLPTLLSALKRERLYDRWLQVYLRLLYAHPTHQLVGVLADEAVSISQAVGQQEAVAAAFCHLSSIPLEFRAKAQIERSLVRLGTDGPPGDDTHEHAS